MIYRASIGEIHVLLDDEMVDERPTPEGAEDYLPRAVAQVIRLYEQIPEEAVASDGDE